VDFGLVTFLLGYGAGALSTLSPCVVPLLPILVASALAGHRLGLWALAAGLALSFALVGVFVATVGFSIGLETASVHRAAGALLVAFGAVMAVPSLQRVFEAATAPVARAGGERLARVGGQGWSGQLAVGLLIGLVWTPCVGPTLGAASTLASQGRDLGAVAALMLVFGLGAATPLFVVGLLSRRITGRPRWMPLGSAASARCVIGACLAVVGLVVFFDLDRPLETWLVDRSPDWLTRLTTRL
jgi:cytochrome c biogenesis protein CcdA